MAVLEAAMLEVDAKRVRALADGVADGAVLVATPEDREAPTPADDPILGALVLDGRTIEALAVRPRRRGQGIGSALVRAARDRASDPLIATFDAHLQEFYERLGFSVERIGVARCRGRLE